MPHHFTKLLATFACATQRKTFFQKNILIEFRNLIRHPKKSTYDTIWYTPKNSCLKGFFSTDYLSLSISMAFWQQQRGLRIWIWWTWPIRFIRFLHLCFEDTTLYLVVWSIFSTKFLIPWPFSRPFDVRKEIKLRKRIPFTP